MYDVAWCQATGFPCLAHLRELLAVQLAVPIYPVAGENAKTVRHGVVAEMKRVLDGNAANGSARCRRWPRGVNVLEAGTHLVPNSLSCQQP